MGQGINYDISFFWVINESLNHSLSILSPSTLLEIQFFLRKQVFKLLYQYTLRISHSRDKAAKSSKRRLRLSIQDRESDSSSHDL